MIRSHSHVGSGPKAVPRPPALGGTALGLREGGAGFRKRGHCLPLATAHSPCQEDSCQPWCRSSLGVDYLLGQPGHVTSPEDTSEIKGTFPEPGITGLFHGCARQGGQPRLPQALLAVLILHAFLRSQSNLTSF